MAPEANGQWTRTSLHAGLSPLGSQGAGCRGQYYHEGEGRAPPRLIAFSVLIDICRASIFSTLPNHFLPEEPLLAFVPPKQRAMRMFRVVKILLQPSS